MTKTKIKKPVVPTTERLREYINEFIERTGITAYAISRRAGLNPNRVKNISSGAASNMTVETAGKIMEACASLEAELAILQSND